MLELVLTGISQHMPVDVYLPEVPAAAEAPITQLTPRLVQRGAIRQAADDHAEPASALPRIRATMFVAPAKPAIVPDGTARLVSAPDPSREVRAAARACLQWAAEGVPFWDMAIAYRQGEAYLRWPKRCSSKRGYRCTCTRARRWPSDRSGARRWGYWRCSTAICCPVGDGFPHRRATAG